MKRFKEIPIVGIRTMKTVIAVFLSAVLMKYVFNETPFFACIGAVVAVERTMASSFNAAIIRNVGTITGGIIGIIFSFFTQSIELLSLGIIPLVYVQNLIGKRESIVPSAIVYFAVVYLNTSETSFTYGFRRIIGTLLGTLIGMAINYIIFPPKEIEKNTITSDVH